MPKIVILGSCRFEPYIILAKPDPLNTKYTVDKHEEYNTESEYQNAAKIFYPAIDEADLVIVYAPDGIGEHTGRDLEYAKSKGKKIVIIKGE